MNRIEQLWWQLIALLIMLPIATTLAFQVVTTLVILLTPIVVFATLIATATLIVGGCIAMGSYLLRRRSTPHSHDSTPPGRSNHIPLTVQPMRRSRRLNQ